MSKVLTGVFMIGLLLLCQVSVSHAGNIFVLLPGIQGDATEPNHIGWIDVKSVSWGHGEAPPGSPIKIQFGRVSIVKLNDSISASLALLGATGQPIKDVKLEITKVVNEVPVVVSRMKLSNARVASYATLALSAGNEVNDSIGFSFDTITWINFKVAKVGQQAPAPGSAACWDVINNKTCVPQF